MEKSLEEEVKRLAWNLSNAKAFSEMFLLKKTLGAEEEKAECFGVNTLQVQEFFRNVAHLCKEDKSFQNKIQKNVKKNLLESLGRNERDNEASMKIRSRVFLMLPECHLFEEPSLYESIICPFADSFLSLGEKLKRELVQNWGNMKMESEGDGNQAHVTQFSKMVKIYQHCFQHILDLKDTNDMAEVKERHRHLKICLDMLDYLYQVNKKLEIISYKEFYVELKDKVNVEGVFLNKRNNKMIIPGMVYICDYPFLFNAEAKTTLMHKESFILQQAKNSEHNTFSVSRSSLASDSLNQVRSKTNLRGRIQVAFKDEDRVGGDAPVREFFYLLSKDISRPEFDMLKSEDESGLPWFNPMTKRKPEDFEMVGKLLVLALYNKIPVNMQFPLVLYKKLLDRPVSLQDFSEVSKTHARCLNDIIKFEGDQMKFEIAFGPLYIEPPYVTSDEESETQVTQANKHEYVKLVVDYHLNKEVDVQFQAFKKGFFSICDAKFYEILKWYEPEELRDTMEGNSDYDFQALQENAVYQHVFNKDHPTIKMFWEVFHELDLTFKKKFLKFIRGSDRLSVFGMKQLQMKIAPLLVTKIFQNLLGILYEVQEPVQDDSSLPCAITCHSQLLLPLYSSKAALKEKLMTCVEQNKFLYPEGFTGSGNNN